LDLKDPTEMINWTAIERRLIMNAQC